MIKNTKSRADTAVSPLGLMLHYSHKLKLDKKSKEELKVMLQRHESSLYSKLYRTLRIPYPQRYLAISEAIQGRINWHNMLEERKVMFGRKNFLELALSNEQLEKMYGIKPEFVGTNA